MFQAVTEIISCRFSVIPKKMQILECVKCRMKGEERSATYIIYDARKHTSVWQKKQTNNNSPAACACSGSLRSSVVDVSQKFSLSPCIYAEYFSNICETRGPPALIGDPWSEGEAWNMYTTVVTVASRLSESSNKSAQVALQGRGGYTHCLTHSGCIQNIVCDFRCGQ